MKPSTRVRWRSYQGVWTPFDIIRVTLGLLLVTAAVFKSYELATEPTAESSLLTSRWFLIVLVEFELFLGIWLLSGRYQRTSCAVAVACFTGFACVSFWKATADEVSCGCFGRAFDIHPWTMFTLDSFAIASLLIWRPADKRFPATTDAIAICCLPLSLSPKGAMPAPLRMSSTLRKGLAGGLIAFSLVLVVAWREVGSVPTAEFAFLQAPQELIGKSLPLQTDLFAALETYPGDGLVLVVRDGCSHCQELLTEVDRHAGHGIPLRHLCVIHDSPQFDLHFPNMRHHVYATYRSADLSAVFFESPVMMRVGNGKVVAVLQGKEVTCAMIIDQT